jgi:hypothetical protein
LGAQSEAWQRVLHAELGEFIRKRDDRFRHERQASEADAGSGLGIRLLATYYTTSQRSNV